MDLEKKIREYREYTRLIEEATATRDLLPTKSKLLCLKREKTKWS